MSRENLRWQVRMRDYELDAVKYQAKLTPVMADQDPLNTEVIKLPAKKKIIKKGNVTMKRSDFNPLEMPNMIKGVGSNFSNNLKNQNLNSSTTTSTTLIDNNSDKFIATNVTSSLSNKISELTKSVQLADNFKFLSYSLIVNKNFNTNDSLDINWTSIKKNLMDIFCNNFNMEVKSVYTINFEEEDKKNYKIEQGRNRLDEIEGEKKNSKFNVISSGEYVAKMEILKREMLQKWEVEDKVGTLKIIIHCTKMLNDVFTPKFYTHKFLITADILDIFSKLIYDRIYKFSFKNDQSYQFNDINPSIINNVAKDICLNWILKCCCIRELLPRIYIDIVFLKMFKFIYTEKEIEKKIITIAKMIKGISHPLISFYASMYLARVALTVFPKSKQFLFILLENISNFALNEETIKKLNYDNITIEELKKVLEPCVEWMVYCLTKNITASQFNNLVKIYDQTKNYFILKNLIIHTPIKFIFNQEYLEYIFACSDVYDFNEGISLYIIICHRLINSNFPIEGKYIIQMWEKIKKNKSKLIFIDCCVLLGEIVIKFYPDEIQDKFFEEVFEIFKTTIATTNFSSSSQEEMNYYHKFEIFLYSTITKISNYSNILNVDNFLFLLENFHPEIKLNICFTIMGHIISSQEKIKDPYLAFSLLKIGKYIHDSVETYSNSKEVSMNPAAIINSSSKKKEVTEILREFIRKVDFGIDYENYLNFLTEARGTYTDIEEIIELLIYEVQNLCIQTYKIVKGKHNKKTLRFCKVCIAYCQITIPSFKNLLTQVKLLFSTAQIALTNNLISECDSILKNMITVIAKIVNELDKKDLEYLTSFCNALTSFLVIVPSNPESPFQLVSGILNIFESKDENVERNPTRNNNYSIRAKIKLNLYLSLVKYLTTQLQIKLPYHLANIDSNDEIFISDEIYRNEGNNLIEKIITNILSEISEFDSLLSNYDYDDYDFLSLFCISCADSFSRNFFETKYSRSVVAKLIELANKYVENLKRNSQFKNKTDNYREYINRLNIS